MAVARRKNRWVLLLPLVVVGGAVAAWLVLRARDAAVSETPLWTVTRGPMRITVSEGGSLQSLNPTTVASEVKGETKIVAVVAEGTYLTTEDVAAGRVIVELDKSGLEEKLQRQVVTVSGAEAELAQSQEALKIQGNQNDSDLRKAGLEVQFARIDLQKYVGETLARRLEEQAGELAALDFLGLAKDPALEGEGLQERRRRESDIDLAREEVARARDKLKWTDELLAKGYVSQDEQVADKLALKRNDVALDQATTALALYLTYEFKKEVQRLTSDLREAKEEAARVARKAASSLASAQADVKGKEDKLRLERSERARIEGEIASCTIRAKNPGLVVYASSEDRGNYMSDEKPIQPGATIRERQPILSIPDPKSLGVRINVHESALAKVRPKMTASVVVDAFPEQPLAGRVDRIATLPNSANRWQNPDLKLYATDVILENPPQSLRPGMSARVEIVVDEIASTLAVPTPAVAIAAGKPSIWVRTRGGDAPRAVRLGASNDRFVEVLEGLAEGDVVLLAPPKSPQQGKGRDASGAAAGPPANGARGGRRDGAGGGRPATSGAPPAANPSGGATPAPAAGRDAAPPPPAAPTPEGAHPAPPSPRPGGGS